MAATLRATDPINIQFTSGTTGFPKGATLTHRNILNNGFFIGECMKLTPDDRLCIPVPLYHCFGMVLGNLACLTHGSAIVYPNDGFDPLTVLQTVQDEKCTGLHGVPTMFIAELDHPRFAEFDLGSLRTGIMAGSPCPTEVMKRVVEQMNLREITIAYGMTETSPVSCQSSTDTPLDKRVSTVGQVQPHLEIKIVDPETGAVVPRGQRGEFCTKGYSVMHGYWGDEAKTREAIDADGWMHTGDLATMDAEGYVNIVGRIKDMVIRGGENIYPREIEEFLYRHPAGAGRAGGGRARPEIRRRTLRLDHRQARHQAHRRRHPRLLQGPDRALQGAALHPLCHQLSDDGDGQDPEVQDPRRDDGPAGPGRSQNGVKQRSTTA